MNNKNYTILWYKSIKFLFFLHHLKVRKIYLLRLQFQLVPVQHADEQHDLDHNSKDVSSAQLLALMNT